MSWRLAFGELAGAARKMLAMSVSVGMRVLAEMIDEELTARFGPSTRSSRNATATRHANAPSSVVFGGRRLKVQRSRGSTPRAPRSISTLLHLRRRRRPADIGRPTSRSAPRWRLRPAPPPSPRVSRRSGVKTKKALDELTAR